MLVEAIESAGYQPGEDIGRPDVAVTEMRRDGVYHLTGEGRPLSRWWICFDRPERYPIFSIEDG